jgi:hypothetical protein
MRYHVLLALAVLLPLAAAAASTGTVFAQSCGIQIGSVSATTQYSGSYYYGMNSPWNIQMTVPISTSCPNQGGQLWAVGNVYDTVANTNVGSNNIIMNMNNGYPSGQLVFTVPPSVIEHLLQVQISVYNSYNNGQYSGLVATSSPTVTIHSSSPSSYYYNAPSNSYSYSNSYYNGNPTGYYNGYYYYSNNGNYYYYYPYSYYYYSSYPSYYSGGSCWNGQTIVYYNGAYYYASCYSYHHHYP